VLCSPCRRPTLLDAERGLKRIGLLTPDRIGGGGVQSVISKDNADGIRGFCMEGTEFSMTRSPCISLPPVKRTTRVGELVAHLSELQPVVTPPPPYECRGCQCRGLYANNSLPVPEPPL
jgi:hypothetical protein